MEVLLASWRSGRVDFRRRASVPTMADTMIVEGDDTVKETGTEMRRQEDKVRVRAQAPEYATCSMRS